MDRMEPLYYTFRWQNYWHLKEISKSEVNAVCVGDYYNCSAWQCDDAARTHSYYTEGIYKRLVTYAPRLWYLLVHLGRREF